MQIQTISIIVGSQACNACCPFCVSRMTPNSESMVPKRVNQRNLEVACDLASRCGATTAMITGKGEPTLWPDAVTHHVRTLSGKFPLVELQTNGILIAGGTLDSELETWHRRDGCRLTTVAVSVAHWDPSRNAEIYGAGRASALDGIEKLHSIGYSVRLCVTMAKGWIDSPDAVKEMIGCAKRLGVEQLTLTPVNRPKNSASSGTSSWVDDHQVDVKAIRDFLTASGDVLMHLPHGAEVFDYEGQNVCLNNCLGTGPVGKIVRNLIFHPDGHLRFDWSHAGSIIL